MTDKLVEPPRIDESAIAEQAARWHVVLRTAGPRELTELSAWLKMSPRHGHHFLFATAIDRLLTHIDPDGSKFNPQEWIEEARENVVALNVRPASATAAEDTQSGSVAGGISSAGLARPRLRRSVAASLAAGFTAVLLVAGWVAAVQKWGWKEWVTQTGEQRIVELEDGSVVYLNTATRVRVRLSPDARDIRLAQGEALFKVHRDVSRPFRVHAPGSIIQAVGTQFNVYRRDEGTRVAVLEGAVRITAEQAGTAATGDSASLTAGEAAEIDPRGQVSRRPAAEGIDVIAWRQRRLVFRADALAELTTEFNRYNRTPKFRLEGVDGHDRHYTGTFDADDPESFATVLAQENFYAVERTPDSIIVRSRQ